MKIKRSFRKDFILRKGFTLRNVFTLRKGFTIRKGFTFIEIMICVAVISIFLFTAGASFDFERRALQNAAEIFISDAELAQNLAMRENMSYGVACDPEEYRIVKLIGSSEITVRTTSLSNGIVFTTNGFLILLNNLGSPIKGDTIILKSSRYEAEITVELSTMKPILKEIRRIP